MIAPLNIVGGLLVVAALSGCATAADRPDGTITRRLGPDVVLQCRGPGEPVAATAKQAEKIVSRSLDGRSSPHDLFEGEKTWTASWPPTSPAREGEVFVRFGGRGFDIDKCTGKVSDWSIWR